MSLHVIHDLRHELCNGEFSVGSENVIETRPEHVPDPEEIGEKPFDNEKTRRG